MSLPTDAKARKDIPVITGCFDYFPDALAAVARLSKKANEKHNPGEPLHWSKGKSNDHADCLGRHLAERGTVDEEMQESHTVHVAWRGLALLQTEIDAAREKEKSVLCACGAIRGESSWGPCCKPEQPTGGWRPWFGGDCPVADAVRVDVRFRDGMQYAGQPASQWGWKHMGGSGDVLAWRLA